MEKEIADFWQRHPELQLLDKIGVPGITIVYNFMAPDGVRVNASIDFGRWKHMSFSKRQPPLFHPDTRGLASDAEIRRYLDFFGPTPWIQTASPLGSGIVHFYEEDHPEFKIIGR